MEIIRKIILKAIQINNALLFFITVFLIVFSTMIMMVLEPETFQKPFDALWWVMTTVTTVGYGDLYPVTTPGRIYTIFLYIVGIGTIGVVIGKVVDAFVAIRKRREEGSLNYHGKNHIIIVGWSKKAHHAAKEILQTDDKINIVIIDQLEKSPLMIDRVYYVKGDATDERTLRQANINHAKALLVFSDDSIKDPMLQDGKTLLIATMIEHLAPHVHTTVEIMKEDHIKSFQHANVDEFVLADEMISRIAVRSAFSNGITSIFSQLLSRREGDDLYEIKARQEWKTYRDAFTELLSMGATLISDRGELHINRRLDELIPNDAKLYVICDRNTYERITDKDKKY